MAKVTDAAITALKSYFEAGDQPTQAQFEDFIEAVQEAAQDHEHKSTGGSGSGTGDAAPVKIYKTAFFAVWATLQVGTQVAPTVQLDAACTGLSVYLYAIDAPTGSAIIVDVNLDGTTIFTTQANRPQIAAGQNSGYTTTLDVTSFPLNSRLDIDIDQVGSTTPGGKLSVEVRCTQTTAD